MGKEVVRAGMKMTQEQARMFDVGKRGAENAISGGRVTDPKERIAFRADRWNRVGDYVSLGALVALRRGYPNAGDPDVYSESGQLVRSAQLFGEPSFITAEQLSSSLSKLPEGKGSYDAALGLVAKRWGGYDVTKEGLKTGLEGVIAAGQDKTRTLDNPECWEEKLRVMVQGIMMGSDPLTSGGDSRRLYDDLVLVMGRFQGIRSSPM